MAAKSLATLKSQMPIGVAGASSVSDIHDFLDSTLPTEELVTYAASISINLDTQPDTMIIMAGNPTITVSGLHNGGTALMKLFQDSTGNRVPSFTGATAGNIPTWRTTDSPLIPNVVSFFRSNGVTYYYVS